jgi:flavin-binding protein dodecin
LILKPTAIKHVQLFYWENRASLLKRPNFYLQIFTYSVVFEKHFRSNTIYPEKGGNMSDSVYKIIELVGTSKNSWEEAAANAIETASNTLIDLRIAEVTKLDMKIEDGKIVTYRARINLSIKYARDVIKW